MFSANVFVAKMRAMAEKWTSPRPPRERLPIDGGSAFRQNESLLPVEAKVVGSFFPYRPRSCLALQACRVVADKYRVPMVKITSAARIALLGVQEADVDRIWADLGMSPGNVVGICVRSVKACPGTTYCKRGQMDSLGVGMIFDEKYHGMELPGKMKIGVSGCPNQCGETSFKDIGLVGTPKGWRVYVGGNGGTTPRIGDILAQRIDTETALAIVDKILAYYRANAKPKERMGRMIERLGLEAMEEALGLGSEA